jgi:hypothetical protein
MASSDFVGQSGLKKRKCQIIGDDRGLVKKSRLKTAALWWSCGFRSAWMAGRSPAVREFFLDGAALIAIFLTLVRVLLGAGSGFFLAFR